MAVDIGPSSLHYRPLLSHDLGPLPQALPGLLGGNWSLELLEQLVQEQNSPGAHQLRVLSPSAAGSAAVPVQAFAEFVVVLDECQLLNIAVLPGHQRQGLGRQLLAELLREAVALGCVSCVLEVRRSNAAALRFYAAAGFEQVGLRKDYYPVAGEAGGREDALLFARRLD